MYSLVALQVPTLLGVLLLDESMPPLKLVGIWAAFAAVYLLTVSKAAKAPQHHPDSDGEQEREALLQGQEDPDLNVYGA